LYSSISFLRLVYLLLKSSELIIFFCLINEKKKLIILLQPILADYMKKNDVKFILNKKNILIGREDLNKTLEIIDIVNKKINN